MDRHTFIRLRGNLLFYESLENHSTGADAIKKFTPSLGIPYLGV